MRILGREDCTSQSRGVLRGSPSDIVGGAFAAACFSLDHPILGIWFTYLVFAAAVIIVTTHAARIKPKHAKYVWAVCGTMLLVGAIGFRLWSINLPKKEDPYSGFLQPAKEPMPPVLTTPIFLPAPKVEQFAKGSAFFFFGGNLVVNESPTRPIPLVRSSGENLLELFISTNGACVSGKFFDKEGKIVARLESNKFVVNRLNFLDLKFSRDRSELTIKDQSDVEVLNIKYLNPSAFLFSGMIRARDGGEAKITRTNIILNTKSSTDWRLSGGVAVGYGLLDMSGSVGFLY